MLLPSSHALALLPCPPFLLSSCHSLLLLCSFPPHPILSSCHSLLLLSSCPPHPLQVIIRLRNLSRRTREALEAARNRANLSRTVRAKWGKLRATNGDRLGLAARLGDFRADVRRFSLRVRNSIATQPLGGSRWAPPQIYPSKHTHSRLLCGCL